MCCACWSPRTPAVTRHGASRSARITAIACSTTSRRPASIPATPASAASRASPNCAARSARCNRSSMANEDEKAPPGACDCHMHAYEPGYPLAPTAVAAAPPGPLAEYLEIRDRLGLTRTVVVQPTAYGADNSCTLAAIAALGPRARGVAMVTGEETDGELERLAQGGITGVRFRTFPAGARPR